MPESRLRPDGGGRCGGRLGRACACRELTQRLFRLGDSRHDGCAGVLARIGLMPVVLRGSVGSETPPLQGVDSIARLFVPLNALILRCSTN